MKIDPKGFIRQYSSMSWVSEDKDGLEVTSKKCADEYVGIIFDCLGIDKGINENAGLYRRSVKSVAAAINSRPFLLEQYSAVVQYMTISKGEQGDNGQWEEKHLPLIQGMLDNIKTCPDGHAFVLAKVINRLSVVSYGGEDRSESSLNTLLHG